MSILRSLRVASMAAMLVLSGAAETEAAKCKDVSIRVKNNGSRKIKTQKMFYRFAPDSKERSEGLPNKQVQPGADDFISKRNLTTGLGWSMNYMKLQYKVWCGGKWSKSIIQIDEQLDDRVCVKDKVYRIDIYTTSCDVHGGRDLSPVN